MSSQLINKERTDVALNEGENENQKNKKIFVPRADIYESKNQIVILADMPGINESSVDITLERNVLMITGSSRPRQIEGYTLTYAEYGHGDFRRVFTLSSEIDQSGIEATVKDGVLKLVLPKSPRALPKKIAITAD